MRVQASGIYMITTILCHKRCRVCDIHVYAGVYGAVLHVVRLLAAGRSQVLLGSAAEESGSAGRAMDGGATALALEGARARVQGQQRVHVGLGGELGVPCVQCDLYYFCNCEYEEYQTRMKKCVAIF